MAYHNHLIFDEMKCYQMSKLSTSLIFLNVMIMTSKKYLEYIVTSKQAYIYFNFYFTFGSEIEWQASFHWDPGHNMRPTLGSQRYKCQVKADRLMRKDWTASSLSMRKKKKRK